MDLDFSEEQQLLQDMAKSLLAEHSTIDIVREYEDDPKGYPDELWKQVSEAGLAGVLIAEEYGGAGMNLLDAAMIYEEFGRYMAPVPHFVSAVMSAGILGEAGSDAQKTEWLPKIASGDSILTPAWLERDRGFGERGIALPATADGDGFVLNGEKRHVNYALAAERMIVLARTDAGVDLFLVDPKADGVELNQVLSQSGEPHFDVTFSNVRVGAGDRIGAAGSGWATYSKVMQRGIILQAAWAIGGAERCLLETVDYANTRVQFDKPLGAFQSLAHYMADDSTRIEGGRVLVYEAAWNDAQGRSIARFAPMAKLFCSNAYRDCTASCAQIWGGVAFTIEYDTQLFFRRAKQLQLSWWDTPYLEELIAADVLD